MGAMKWLDITNDLTPEGIRNLKSGKHGDILMFTHPKAGPIHLRITCKRNGRVYAVRTYAYTPEEADAEVEVAQKK